MNSLLKNYLHYMHLGDSSFSVAGPCLWNSAYRITWQRYLTCTVQETFEDTLICAVLQRIVTVAFLCRVQMFLLTYLLILHTTHSRSWRPLPVVWVL